MALSPGCVRLSHPCNFLLLPELPVYVAKHLAAPLAAFEAHHQFPNRYTNIMRWGVAGIAQAKVTKDVFECWTTPAKPLTVCEPASKTPYTDAVVKQIRPKTETTTTQITLRTPDPDISNNPSKNPFALPTSPAIFSKGEPAKRKSSQSTTSKKNRSFGFSYCYSCVR